MEFTGESHLRRGSGGPFWDNFGHSFEVMPDGWAGQGAETVQMVWTGVEKEEKYVKFYCERHFQRRSGCSGQTMR